MPTFRNFANRGFDKNLPAKPISIRHPNPHNNGIGPRLEKLLADDFGKCRSRADYEQYISKYGKYTSNKYISLAQDKIKAIDEEEKKKRAEAARRKKTSSIPPDPKPDNLFRIGLIAIVAGIIFLSYTMYQSSQEPELPPQPYPIIPTISSDDNTSGGYHVIFKGSTFEKTKAKCSKCSRCSGYWGYKHLNGTYEGDCRNSDGHGHTCGHSPQCHGLREW